MDPGGGQRMTLHSLAPESNLLSDKVHKKLDVQGRFEQNKGLETKGNVWPIRNDLVCQQAIHHDSGNEERHCKQEIVAEGLVYLT